MWTHLSRYKGGIGVRGPGENAARRRPPAGRSPHPRSQGEARQGPGPQGARGRQPRRRAHRLAGRLHQRRQEHADERPDRRRRPGRGQAVLDARHPHPALAVPRLGPGRCSPTRSASSATCRTIWSPRSRPRSRRPARPTCCCTSSTPRSPEAEEQIQAVKAVLAELGLDDQPTLLVLNKADKVPDRSYPRRAQGPPRRVGRHQRRAGRGARPARVGRPRGPERPRPRGRGRDGRRERPRPGLPGPARPDPRPHLRRRPRPAPLPPAPPLPRLPVRARRQCPIQRAAALAS